MTQQARRGSEDQDGVGTFMINGLAVPAVQQPTFGVAQRNQQVRPPALDFASALSSASAPGQRRTESSKIFRSVLGSGQMTLGKTAPPISVTTVSDCLPGCI
jgi:hypothetical protein